MKQIFISYSARDEASYSLFCAAVDATGIRRWNTDHLRAGEALAASLRSAISECDLCVFLATSNSLASKWCLAELGAFWGAGKRVIFFLADPDLGEDAIPPQFKGDLWTRNAQQVIRSIQGADSGRVRSTPTGYQVQLGGTTINVQLGRIEQAPSDCVDCLVALPANEYFDDECISDARSALGAYMQAHYRDGIGDIKHLICSALEGAPCDEVEKRPSEKATSYGIGHAVLLDRPLGSERRVALVAATTQRADAGLQATPEYIFKAADCIQRLMANHRLTRLYVPLMGAGHGGLRAGESLLCTLLAFAGSRGVRRPKEINIVVFQADPHSPPDVPPSAIKAMLRLVSDVYST